MSTEVETSIEVTLLEALDFNVACSHSQHESRPEAHSGDAEFDAHYTAPCGLSTDMFLCAKFVAQVPSVDLWRCRVCHGVHEAAEVTWSFKPLNEPT